MTSSTPCCSTTGTRTWRVRSLMWTCRDTPSLRGGVAWSGLWVAGLRSWRCGVPGAPRCITCASHWGRWTLYVTPAARCHTVTKLQAEGNIRPDIKTATDTRTKSPPDAPHAHTSHVTVLQEKTNLDQVVPGDVLMMIYPPPLGVWKSITCCTILSRWC